MNLEPIQEKEGNYTEFYITYRNSDKIYVTKQLHDFLNDYR